MTRYSTTMAQIQEQMMFEEYIDGVLQLDDEAFNEYYDSLDSDQQQELEEVIGKIAKGIGKVAVSPITLPFKAVKGIAKGVKKVATSSPVKKAAGAIARGAGKAAAAGAKGAVAGVKKGINRLSVSGRADAAKKKADKIAKRNQERERLAREKDRVDQERQKARDAMKKDIEREKTTSAEYDPKKDKEKKDMKEEDIEEKFKPTAGELYVVTAGPGDNAQKVIGTNKDLKKAQKMRDDYNKKNKPSKPSHKARVYAQTRASQPANKFKTGDKIMYSTYGNKAQFTKVKENFFKEEVEDIEEFSDSQIKRLQKEYEPLRGKETGVNPQKFAKLRKMMKRMKKPQLMALVKANIPILTSAAKASLVINHGMKWSSLPEDFLPYIEVFADDTLDEQKSKFKSVDTKVLQRVSKMMRGTKQEKQSIANMLNYFMPPEVVDMIRDKFGIKMPRGKIKFTDL